MTHRSKLITALATTSVLALSVAGAHAGVVIPRPAVHIAIPKPAVHIAVPKPVIHIAVPKPAVHVAVPKPVIHTAIPKPAVPAIRPTVVLPTASKAAAPPVTVKGTPSNWQGPTGAGTRSTSMIYLNGKPVGATSAIAISKPSTSSAIAPSNRPIVPGTVPVAKPSAPAPVAAKPPAPAPAAAPAKPKVTFTPVKYVAFKDQYGAVKGYYKDGKLVMGLTGPSGGNCGLSTAYQVLGSGTLSSTFTPGAILVTTVQCYTKS